MRLVIVSVWATVAFTWTLADYSAQTAKTTQTTRSATMPKQAIVYSDAPLNPTGASVAPNYQGVDCRRVVAALKRLSLAKGEFETTTDYDRRLANLSRQSLFGSIRLDDTIAFRVPETSQIVYDADKQKIRVTLPDSYDVEIDDVNSRNYYRLGAQQLSVSYYFASNAYGAKTRVRKTTGRVCGAAFKVIWGAAVPEEFELSPTDAQQYKAAPGVILVGKLEAPFLTVGHDRDKATFTNPFERDILVDAVRFNPSEVWYFNSKSGTVLHRRAVKHLFE